ncbi:MAG: LacI family DNA-binding transcriptional regulator [Armatimonadota bacterium]
MSHGLEPQAPSRGVTLQDIADRCGVHKASVSRALRGDRRFLSEDTITRIAAVAAEMGYDSSQNHTARRLALHKYGQQVVNHVIAVFFPPYTYRSNYSTELFWGIWEGLNREGFTFLGINTKPPNLQGQPTLPPALSRGDADGAIILSHPDDFQPTLTKLRSLPHFGDRPVIFLVWQGADCPTITVDYEGGAYAAAEHLLALGHTDLLQFFTEDSVQSPHRLRLAGYRRACAGFAGRAPVHLHSLGWNEWQIEQSITDILTMLKQQPEITAILAPNDLGAVLIANALRQHGMRIPDDISIVGYDDTDPLYTETGSNILTTVRVPLHDLGLEAARSIAQWVAGHPPIEQISQMPTTLIVRGSTAPPKRG